MAERIVEVEWEDSFGKCGWQAVEEDMPENTLIKSVGYVRVENTRGIVLTVGLVEETWGKRPSDDCKTFIPRSAIRKVIELRPKGRK